MARTEPVRLERLAKLVVDSRWREVGSLLYFQMSEHVADAMTPATEAKRAAFEKLVAPLLPPR